MNKTKMYFIFTVLLLLSCFLQPISAQIYEKKDLQNVDEFISQVMPKGGDFSCHEKLIKAAWGDESMGKKIMFFYSDQANNYAVCLQPVGLQNDKYALINKLPIGIGQFPQDSKVISVFFEDVLGDGNKQMIVISEGTLRRTKSNPDPKSTFQTYIFQQPKTDSDYQLNIEEIYPTDAGLGLEKLDLRDLKSESEVRQAITQFKAQQFKAQSATKGR